MDWNYKYFKEKVKNNSNTIKKINLPRYICEHLIGENHTTFHRHFVGFCIMVIGISIAKFSSIIGSVGHFFLDLLGYLIHAIGGVPFVDSFLKTLKEVKENNKEENKN